MRFTLDITASITSTAIVGNANAYLTSADLLRLSSDAGGQPRAELESADDAEEWQDPETAFGPSEILHASYLPLNTIPTKPAPYRRFVRGWSFLFVALGHLLESPSAVPTLSSLLSLLSEITSGIITLPINTTTPSIETVTIDDFHFFAECGGKPEHALDALLSTAEDETNSGSFDADFGFELDEFPECRAHDLAWVRARRELLGPDVLSADPYSMYAQPGWASFVEDDSDTESVEDPGHMMEEV
ncbi:hypothetical protein RQP46_004260 [Phenoliferia psychrophenolica]